MECIHFCQQRFTMSGPSINKYLHCFISYVITYTVSVELVVGGRTRLITIKYKTIKSVLF